MQGVNAKSQKGGKWGKEGSDEIITRMRTTTITTKNDSDDCGMNEMIKCRKSFRFDAMSKISSYVKSTESGERGRCEFYRRNDSCFQFSVGSFPSFYILVSREYNVLFLSMHY